jgi:hypothetical protein
VQPRPDYDRRESVTAGWQRGSVSRTEIGRPESRGRTIARASYGLRGVWHGGPFAHTDRYVFYPRRIFFGTDPVAIDRLLLDLVDQKRKMEGAISIWDRSPAFLRTDDTAARDNDPNVNILVREPGHVEYASRLGLGVSDIARIDVQQLEV